MAEYNVQQKQFIQEYKAQHKLTNQTDEQIMLFIQKDMQTNGVVYPGFEHLANPNTSASSTTNGQIFDTSNKPNENKGISVEKSSTTETSDNLSSEGKEVTTDENGNTITTIKDGDDIIEQTISSTDEKGNNIETVVNYQDGKPIKQTKKKNGNIDTVTTYKYHESEENKLAYVTLETTKADNTKVITTALETDKYGNVDQEDFISRKTISRDGTETTVIIGSECIKEDKVKIDGKKVSTLYKGTNLADFDSHKLHRVAQETEIDGVKRYAEYDGKGNTKTTVQNGESPALIAQKFNVKEQALMRLNPQKGKNAITQVGADILIPGEFNADSYPMRVRKSKTESLNKYSQFEARRLAKEINSGDVENVKLAQSYNNVYELAKDNLIKSGVKNPSNQQVNDEANKLILLNGKNVNLKAGASVKVAKSLTNSKHASELTKYGFQASAENRIFFQKFNNLNSQQKQNVLSAIQYCKSQKITNLSDIKAKVFETLGINLFDSDKTVPMVADNNYGVMAYQRNRKPISIETFVKDHLKLDIKSEPGKTVLNRLSQVEQTKLNKISAKDFKGFNNKTLDSVASMLETVGVQIRTQAEINVKNNTPRAKAEKEKRAVRTAAAENIALAYDNAINVIKNYQGNQGWMNIGFYREKLGQLLDKVNPTDVATCFDAVIKRLEKEKQYAVSRLKTASANEREFKQAFKDLTGKDYNENAVKNFLTQAQKGGDWSKSYDQAFGDKVVKRATDKVNFQQYVDGAGDIVLMLLGTEAIGKGVAWAGGKVATKLAPYVPKVLSNLGAKGIMTIGNSTVTVGKVVGNMATSAATFTAWDATKNYINLKTKDIQYTGEDAVKEWQTYKEGNIESGKFGAFAGLLNSTVVGKVVNGTMKIFEKPVAKAIQGVAKTLEKGEATGADVMKTFIAKQTPGLIAQTAGAIAEVAGFTMYETANEITKELLQTDSNGQRHLPKDLTEEGLTNYLLKHLKGQATNLGEIKAISKLIFMHKGAVVERERMMNENLSKCEMLGKVKIQKAEVDGAEIYAITTPNGNRKIARSPEDVVAYCNVLMQMDMVVNCKTESVKESSQNNIDLHNIENVKSANPSAILRPTEATTFDKKDGITFKPNVNPNDPPAEAYKIAWRKTVEETIELNKKNNVPLELVKDENGEYFLGVKHSWDNDYYRVDRNSIIVKYGEGDFAPVAEDKGARIFSQTYLDESGKTIDISNMEDGKPVKIRKNPDSTVGAVAFDKPQTLTSLEGNLNDVDFARTDVDGHPYGTYTQLANDIKKGKIIANASDPNSAKFVELVKSGKDTEAKALLKQASSRAKQYDSPLAQKLANAKDRKDFVAIRDEIKKMPPSEEKSKLIEIYTQKYHEWSSNPSRPNIRMQYIPSMENPHNVVNAKTASEVGAKANEALSGNTYRIATAGYSAPPEGYEATTKDFLKALDAQLGTKDTAFVTSPTADKGSIDAITSEVAGFEGGKLFYTTAQDYVEYINPNNFPESINKEAYAKVPKFVLPDAESYSQATAECSNAFIATGGRNATVSDFVNAIKKGNKAVILENTVLNVPAWGESKGRVENASKYLAEQIKAVKEGKQLPYPEVGEFTRDFIEKNIVKIDKLVRAYQVDGKTETIKEAANKASEFLKSKTETIIPDKVTNVSLTTSTTLPKGVTSELKELYSKKELSKEDTKRIEELESVVQEHGILVARSPMIKNTQVSMLAKGEPREAFLPDFNKSEMLKEMGFTQGADGKWYHSNRDWYPNALSNKDVVYVFKRDASGKPIDTGFGPSAELNTLYVRSEDFDANNMKFVNPSTMKPGEIISVKKCASGSFCILPVGTKLFTSEGIVEVKEGDIVNVKEAKNSIHVTKMTDIANMYKADPLNPTSKKLFNLISDFKTKEGTLSSTERITYQAEIADSFSRINRSQQLCEVLGDNTTPPTTLRGEFELAAQISKKLDDKYLSKIDVSNFDTALKQARVVLTEIYQDKSLTDIQRNAAVTAVMVRLLPKTNAHQHLKGSVPKDVTLELARQKGFSTDEIAKIEASYSKGEKGYDTLTDFNDSYGAIGRPVSTPEDYRAAIKGIVREALKQGQLTTEIRCACDSLRDTSGKPLSPEEGTEAIISAIESVKSEYRAQGIEPPKTGFVFLTYRGRDWDGSLPSAVMQAKEAVKAAIKHPEMKFGFDVAGPEDSGYGPKYFKEALDIIKDYNNKVDSGEIKGERIGITMHAGETPTFDGGRPGYLSVEEAIEMGVDRVGHGVQAVLNPETMQKMKDSGITVEICGVCNVQSIPINTRGLAMHPIQEFIDKGIHLSLCTDNDAICGSNVSKEYMQFLMTGHSNFMDWNNVKQSARDGIRSAFISEADKVTATQTLETRINQIQGLLTEVQGKANAAQLVHNQAVEQRPNPIVPSTESIEAAKGTPTNAHTYRLSHPTESATAFYDNLSSAQKAIVDKYNIPHDNIKGIHGVLKLKLTKYDTPEIIENRFINTTQGGSLRSKDISIETLQQIDEIEQAKMVGIPHDRVLYLITGRAGGGKSTIAHKLGLDTTCYMPDADDIKPFLPGYKEKGAGFVHEASVLINNENIKEAFSQGLNTVVQTTGWEDYMDEIIADARKNGYTDIRLIHTNVTADNSIQRAASRAAATGRTVDPADIESRTYIDEVVDKFTNTEKGIKEIIVYDNNGSAPTEVSRFYPTAQTQEPSLNRKKVAVN